MGRCSRVLSIYTLCRILRYAAVNGLVAVLVICFPTGCTTQPAVDSAQQKINSEKFPVCSGYGCEITQAIGLKANEWISLHEIFSPVSKTAAVERIRIARAIGRMEQLVGPKTSTSNDKQGGLAGLLLPSQGQMDCIDEATNTSTYLTLLLQEKLIVRHELQSHANRILPYGWPHTTAVLRDNESKELFAVDSWFLENGRDAQIVPLTKWRWGWTPEQ